MSLMTTRLATALAGIALVSLPVVAGSQSTSRPQPTTPQTTQQPQTRSTSQQNRSSENNSAQHHLDEAKRVLNSIDADALQGEMRSEVAELRKHFAQLETAWQQKAASGARASTKAGGHVGGHTGTTTSTAGTTSGTPAATAAGTSGTPEQAGATGATTTRSTTTPENWMTHYQAIDDILDRLLPASSAAAKTAAGSGQAKIAEFRRHIDLFHSTAMSQSKMGEEDAASAIPQSGVTGSMTGVAGTSGTVNQPSTTDQMTTPAPQMRGTSAGAEATAIARLSAQVDDLLSGTAATGTAGTSGTTDATAGGTVCVERAKLEQLKRDIQALQNRARR
jgi:hypothetical protein